MTHTVTLLKRFGTLFGFASAKVSANGQTGGEKFHVSNRYRRNPANLNWLN